MRYYGIDLKSLTLTNDESDLLESIINYQEPEKDNSKGIENYPNGLIDLEFSKLCSEIWN